MNIHLDLELRIISPNSILNSSILDHRISYLKIDIAFEIHSILDLYLFYIRSRSNKIFSLFSYVIDGNNMR